MPQCCCRTSASRQRAAGETLSEAADPDVALAALVRIVEAAGDRGGLSRALDNDAGLSARLMACSGSAGAR